MPQHPDAAIFRCGHCTHAFTDPQSIRNPETYRQSYYEHDHKRWFENPNIKLFDRILREIPPGASVLDVGCGRGDFLRHAAAERPDLNLTGIDLSPNGSSDRIRFIQGDILQLASAGETFDVVASLAVIEHIDDVQAFVSRNCSLLKSAGKLIVMTINDGSLLYRAGRLGRSFGVPLAYNRLYSVHHLHHFTRQSLSLLLKRHQLTVETHLDHNAPVKAMDIPAPNKVIEAVLRTGLYGLWIAGRLTRKSYLQTTVCRLAG
jgi:SAM-dependent methyltransferase